MRLLGHHLYTSLGGQRTVFCSPWIDSYLGDLEQRAAEAYDQAYTWDVAHVDGLWIATFTSPNGVDHVNRQRNLVHQVIVRSCDAQGAFSPLWLRSAALTELTDAGPGIASKLPATIDELKLELRWPRANDLRPILRGPLKPIILTCFDALASPGGKYRIPDVDLTNETDLAIALRVPLLHHPDCRLTTRDRALPVPGKQLPTTVVLQAPGTRHAGSGGYIRPHQTQVGPDGHSAGQLVLDLLAEVPDPNQYLRFFSRVPSSAYVRTERLGLLVHVLRQGALRIDRAGRAQLDPMEEDTEDLQEVMQALADCRAVVLIKDILTGWLDILRKSGALGAQLPLWQQSVQSAKDVRDAIAVANRLHNMVVKHASPGERS